MEIISIDKSGRIIIPASIRKKMNIEDGTQFLIVDMQDKIILEKLDRREIAKRLQEELQGIDIDEVVNEVEAEIDDHIRKSKKEMSPW